MGPRGPVPLISQGTVYLPERVELLAVGDGELARLVLVDAVVEDLALVQQAQGVGPVVVPGPDPGRQEGPVTPTATLLQEAVP